MNESKPPGRLVIFTDFAPGEDEVIDEWYSREHLKSRVVVDGFILGRRYEAQQGTPRYLAVYHTIDSAVLASPAYLQAGSNADAAERLHVANFTHTQRTVCDVTASAGEGLGATLGVITLQVPDQHQSTVRDWLQVDVLPKLVLERGVLMAELWETNAEALRLGSRGFVPRNESIPQWLLVWEATRMSELRAAQTQWLSRAALDKHGVTVQAGGGHYRLLMTLHH